MNLPNSTYGLRGPITWNSFNNLISTGCDSDITNDYYYVPINSAVNNTSQSITINLSLEFTYSNPGGTTETEIVTDTISLIGNGVSARKDIIGSVGKATTYNYCEVEITITYTISGITYTEIQTVSNAAK